MPNALNALLACLMLLVLCACAPSNPRNYAPQRTPQEHGAVGQVQEVRKGDNIMHYEGQVVSDTLRVPQDLVSGGTVLSQFYVPAGNFLKTGEDEKYIFFNRKSTGNRVAKVSDFRVEDIVYIKESGKLGLAILGRPLVSQWDSGFTIEKNALLKERGASYAGRSLSYAGSTDDLLSFRFKDGARTQRLTHNLKDGNIFRHEGAEVEILSHTPQVLTCRVLQGLDKLTR